MKSISRALAVLVLLFSGCTMLAQRSDVVSQLALPEPTTNTTWCDKGLTYKGNYTYKSFGYGKRNAENVCIIEIDLDKNHFDRYSITDNYTVYLDKYVDNELVFTGVYANNSFNIIKNYSQAANGSQSHSPISYIASLNISDSTGIYYNATR